MELDELNKYNEQNVVIVVESLYCNFYGCQCLMEKEISIFSDKMCWSKYKNILKYLYFNDWFQSPQLPTVHKLKRGNSAEKLFELLSKIQFYRNLKAEYQISNILL